MTALEVFTQNEGKVTQAYYADMNTRGPHGQLAVALFRAQKRSTAAKKYRGGRYRSAAYEVKNYSIGEICRILTAYPELNMLWGWKSDAAMTERGDPHDQVLYVTLPQGQCSFHSSQRLAGPDYPGDWDGKKESAERIMAYCDAVANNEPTREMAPSGQAAKVEAHPQPTGVIICGRGRKGSRYEEELARGGGKLVL